MKSQQEEVLLISPFFPDAHPLAYYSSDLTKALNRKFGNSLELKFCAITLKATDYEDQVKYILDPARRQEYFDLAEKINFDDCINSVIIQYDKEIFGGEFGEDILFLLYSLHKPAFVILNNIPKDASHKIRQLYQNIAFSSANVIVRFKEDLLKLERMEIDKKKIKLLQDAPLFEISVENIPEFSMKLINADISAVSMADIIGRALTGSLKFTVPEIPLSALQNIEKGKLFPLSGNDEIINLKRQIILLDTLTAWYNLSGKNFSEKLISDSICNIEQAVKQFLEKKSYGIFISPEEEIMMPLAFSSVENCLFSAGKNLITPDSEKGEEIYSKLKTGFSNIDDGNRLSSLMKGLYCRHKITADAEVLKIISENAEKLLELYYRSAEIEEDEDSFPGVFNQEYFLKFPEAFLYAWLATGKEIYKIISIVTFDYLLNKFIREKQIINRHNNEFPVVYTEVVANHPSEIASIAATSNLFYSVFGDAVYKKSLKKLFSWFCGNNQIKKPIYYPEADICFDGIDNDSLIPTNSIDSDLNYLQSRLLLEQIGKVGSKESEERVESEKKKQLTGTVAEE